MRIVATLLLLSCLGGNAVQAQTPSGEQTEVMMQMMELKNAIVGKDSVSMMRILSKDVTYGHSNGLIQTRAEFIRSVMSGEQDYKAIEPSGVEVRIYGSAAIATLQTRVDMYFQGKPLQMDLKMLMTWVKGKDGWVLVARQAVKIQN